MESESIVPDYGFDELLNGWDDHVRADMLDTDFPAPVYTATEVVLIRNVTKAVEDFSAVTPHSVPNDRSTLALPQWRNLVATAQVALGEMLKRGKFSEDRIIC